jgi:molecular chaperone DnaK (HSP70)
MSLTILDLIGNPAIRRRCRVLGIDLGTTNSTISHVVAEPDGAPVAKTLEVDQPTLQGLYTHTLVPSFVALHGGKTFVGEGAKRLRGHGPVKDVGVFYECKNDIGLKKTYHKAPMGYRSAADIGGHVVKFLRDAVTADEPAAPKSVVVTVPASFQAHQRQDTVMAARLAGIELTPGQLLDEPVAAFIDYLVSKGQGLVEALEKPKTLLVFDFGGGTCDVAIFRIQFAGKKPVLKSATLAVSS